MLSAKERQLYSREIDRFFDQLFEGADTIETTYVSVCHALEVKVPPSHLGQIWGRGYDAMIGQLKIQIPALRLFSTTEVPKRRELQQDTTLHLARGNTLATLDKNDVGLMRLTFEDGEQAVRFCMSADELKKLEEAAPGSIPMLTIAIVLEKGGREIKMYIQNGNLESMNQNQTGTDVYTKLGN